MYQIHLMSELIIDIFLIVSLHLYENSQGNNNKDDYDDRFENDELAKQLEDDDEPDTRQSDQI